VTVGAPREHNLFYASAGSIRQGRIYFDRDETSHLAASLRKAAGQTIEVTDGEGMLYRAEIEEIGKAGAVARITGREKVPQARAEITLYQGFIRPQKMDLIVEKCVELGVAAFVPVLTERALERDAAARHERWRRIAVEAMKQSLRAYRPRIGPAQAFEDVLEGSGRHDVLVVAHEGEGGRLLDGDLISGKTSVGLFVGPEGGFADGEIRALSELGAAVISLGGARLRSETAAIAAVALIGRFLR
jgi:16S rRNA (uracil1498-N3)-methyltransferase